MKYLILLLCLISIVFSCKKDTKTVTITGKFELTIPDFMSEFDIEKQAGTSVHGLNASFKNPGQRFITIVSSESRNVIELLTGDYENPFSAYLYWKKISDDQLYTQLSQNNLEEIEIDGNIAVHCKQTISALGQRMYSVQTIIMTRDTIYQITSLCPPSMKDIYYDKMKEIGLSFREL